MAASVGRRRLTHDEEHLVEKEEWLSVTIGTLLLAFTLAITIGQWLHRKHIYWLPESGSTIVVGFIVRWAAPS